MSETQDALTCKVEEFTELVAAQSLKMSARSEAMAAESVPILEHAVKWAELHGGGEDTPHWGTPVEIANA